MVFQFITIDSLKKFKNIFFKKNKVVFDYKFFNFFFPKLTLTLENMFGYKIFIFTYSLFFFSNSIRNLKTIKSYFYFFFTPSYS